MELRLAPEAKKIIEDRVKAGKYANAEEVVTVALHGLCQAELFGNFAPGELDTLLKEAENSGPPIPFETYMSEFEALREKFIAGRK